MPPVLVTKGLNEGGCKKCAKLPVVDQKGIISEKYRCSTGNMWSKSTSKGSATLRKVDIIGFLLWQGSLFTYSTVVLLSGHTKM